ncbi:protein kinase 4-like [Leptopilina heterotoma]|uniref:protein kinase 4-like n=1 Tax=Leptopilina heterotoma TaxID=63436 RepID=UPI001CA9195B|nr:protein kinase 4-like [Leptopilina heterotoma]
MEISNADVTSEESGKKINNLCNMSWLKHNSKSSSSEIQTVNEIQSANEIQTGNDIQTENDIQTGNDIPTVNDIQNLNEETENEKTKKTVKKRKQKKSKSVVNSKTSDTDTEQTSRKQEKRKTKVLPVTAITVANPPTVWNSKTDAASTLFPNAQGPPIVDEFDEDLQLSKALEESIITAQLEQFRMTPEKNKIQNWADDADEPEWGAVGKNLPEPSENTNRECEVKLEKKPHDDNNNRNNKSNTEENVIKFDKYGRFDGRNERHLFMGKGARVREEHYINQHTDRNVRTSNSDFHSDQRNIREKTFETFGNRNRDYKNYDEKNWNHRNRNQKDSRERNANSNFDNGREYRNRNYQTSNQREGQCNHQYSNQPRKSETFLQSNSLSRYKYRQMDYESPIERNKSNSQKYNQQSKSDYLCPEHRKIFMNEESSSAEKEFKIVEKLEDKEATKLAELPSSGSSVEKIEFKKDEVDEPVKTTETNSCTTSVLDEDSSSLVFMQESLDDSDILINDHASETTSEQSEDNPILYGNPYPNHPYQMMHQTGICPNENNMLPSSQIPNEMEFKLVTNPFIPTVPLSSAPHTQEMLPQETGALPMQNIDMRFYPQHPMNMVHNHHQPGNPYIPHINYPMGMQIHSCGQISQLPVGNIQGINYMHQHPITCQQCPPQFCHSQRIPMQNITCQNYPTQFVTPITTVPLPMAPISPDQIQSARHQEILSTPVTEIGKSVSNLVTLCESLPSRRMGLSNCPPGFENTVYAKSMQRKVIYNNEHDLPTFRNQNSWKSPERQEKITVEFLDNVIQRNLQAYRNNKDNREEESETVCQKPKFTAGSYNERLFETYGDDNKIQKKQNTQTPRPGFRSGFGRGKRLPPTN